MYTPTPGFHLVLLDNKTRPDPLAPDLPYWTFYVPALPSAATAWDFTEEILYESERWTNEDSRGAWVRLRPTYCHHMCPRCGRVSVVTVAPQPLHFYLIWYIVENDDPHATLGPLFLETADWHTTYRRHRCEVNFYDL